MKYIYVVYHIELEKFMEQHQALNTHDHFPTFTWDDDCTTTISGSDIADLCMIFRNGDSMGDAVNFQEHGIDCFDKIYKPKERIYQICAFFAMTGVDSYEDVDFVPAEEIEVDGETRLRIRHV